MLGTPGPVVIPGTPCSADQACTLTVRPEGRHGRRDFQGVP